MCGIVGYCGPQAAAPVVIDGLRRLEYRGYDSAGVAFPNGSDLQVIRRVGKLANLVSAVHERPIAANSGIGHTRWATHGRPNIPNAHPHTDSSGRVAVVHNGIIDNFRPLQAELVAEGVAFASETDTEVIVHLIARELGRGIGFTRAVQLTTARLSGSFAFIALWAGEPGVIMAARQYSPLAIGVGEGENLIASDVPALIPHTRRIMHLENGDVARITRTAVEVWGTEGPAQREISHAPWTPALAERGTYRHFMQKEIFEQPRALADTIQGRILAGRSRVELGGLEDLAMPAGKIERVLLLACGTSLHAALVGRHYLENIAGLPAEIENAAEFQHRPVPPGPRTLVVAVSQSGETFDTLQAVAAINPETALLALTNVPGSSLSRAAQATISTRAGPEIGVASTKTYVASMALLYLLAVSLGRARGHIAKENAARLLQDIAELPKQLDRLLELDHQAERFAHPLERVEHVFFIGRGTMHATALEGALKLKELSYIHAEGYPAGELKHGPIALITHRVPTVVLAPANDMRSKMVSNLEEVKSRDGPVLALGTEGDDELDRRADWMFKLPELPRLLNPIGYVLPLQLLAYHIAVRRGCDVDQPRNLAKTVTVE